MAAAAANDPLPGAPDPWRPSDMPEFRSRPPYVMGEMIDAEPALAERLVRRLASDEDAARLAAAVADAAAAGAPILTTGCGTSEHAAMGIAHLLTEAFGLEAGREIRAIQALELQRRPPASGLVIGVSHEGGTAATNGALRLSRDAGARTALVTVGGGSPGAELAEIVVRTEEQDQSWCHTVGYLSPLIVGAVVAARIGGTRLDGAALRAILDVADDTHAASSIAAGMAGVDRLIIAGSGPDAITARELALKVAEGARMRTSAHELETVIHGHLAAANRWTGMVLVMTDVVPEVLQRAHRVFAATSAIGITTAAILSEPAAAIIAGELTPAGRLILPRTGRVPALPGSLVTSAVALQRLTERLARARNVDPDTLGREDPAQATAHA